MDPRLRIQVLFENLVGTPTKEFKAGLLTEPSFAALRSHVMTLLPDDEQDKDQMSFKYRIEERHGSRWVSFQDTEGLGYAIESRNQDKDYVFIAVVNENKAAAAAVPSPVVSHSTTTITKAKAKSKVAKKTKSTKAKAPPRNLADKVPVERLILSSLKEQLDLGIAAPSRLQVCDFSGYKNLQSKGYVTAMKKLKDAGLVTYPDKDTVALTQEGAAQAPSTSARATTNEEVQERLKNMLKDKAVNVFDILKDGRASRASVVGHWIQAHAVQRLCGRPQADESSQPPRVSQG